MRHAFRVLFLLIFLSMNLAQGTAQLDSLSLLNKNTHSIGLNLGTFFKLTLGAELSYQKTQPISNHLAFELRYIAATFKQINSSRYPFLDEPQELLLSYLGVVPALLIGKEQDFRLDLALSMVLFKDWNDSKHILDVGILPIVNIGFRKNVKQSALRFGLGFPIGIYLGVQSNLAY